MALSKVDYNSLNVTAAASKALKWNSGADGFETGDVAGAMVLLETVTADGSGTTVTFDSNIDSTYKEYIFKFISVHPQTNDANFGVNFRDGGSSYDATKTTTFFRAYHAEAGTASGLGYRTSNDLAQGTGVATINIGMGGENDESMSGYLHLFDPSSTTFVKHFIADGHLYEGGNFAHRAFVGGYANVTAAIDGVQFSVDNGNIDAGTFKMYGVL